MIEISVNISGGCKANPNNWDSIAALEAAVKADIVNALSARGYSISVAVKAVAL